MTTEFAAQNHTSRPDFGSGTLEKQGMLTPINLFAGRSRWALAGVHWGRLDAILTGSSFFMCMLLIWDAYCDAGHS